LRLSSWKRRGAAPAGILTKMEISCWRKPDRRRHRSGS
jgi:hypothetical protein